MKRLHRVARCWVTWFSPLIASTDFSMAIFRHFAALLRNPLCKLNTSTPPLASVCVCVCVWFQQITWSINGCKTAPEREREREKTKINRINQIKSVIFWNGKYRVAANRPSWLYLQQIAEYVNEMDKKQLVYILHQTDYFGWWAFRGDGWINVISPFHPKVSPLQSICPRFLAMWNTKRNINSFLSFFLLLLGFIGHVGNFLGWL